MAETTENSRFVRKNSPDRITIADVTTSGAAGSAITDLTHSALTGTVDNTLADIATADAALEADLKDLGAKINEILAALRSAGLIAT